MRSIALLVLFSAACATPASPRVAATPPAPRETPPPAAVDAARHAVAAIYIDATCATLEKASGHANGYFVADDVLVTVYHAKEASKDLFPAFAAVDEKGCYDARHADQFPEFDALFLRVSGREGGASIRFSRSVPPTGAKVWAVSSENTGKPTAASSARIRKGLHMETRTLSVNPLPAKAKDYARSPVWDASPALRKGDSGSPVLDENGEVVGMLLALISNRQDGRMESTVFLSGWVVEKLLAHCAPCEMDGTSD